MFLLSYKFQTSVNDLVLKTIYDSDFVYNGGLGEGGLVSYTFGMSW